MEELISRQQAIDALRTCYDTETITMDNGDEYINYGDAVGEIEQLPSAEPQRIMGRWITDKQGFVTWTGICNKCGARTQMFDGYYNFLPEPHEIGYDDCANALLKMWMDNVLTDGEYYRIANKLNEKWGKTELPEPYKGVTT